MTATCLYIDADACPVKEDAVRVAERHALVIHFVSNAWMRLPEGPLIKYCALCTMGFKVGTLQRHYRLIVSAQ